MASLWDAIDDELYRLPPELKDPRFDSLRHVLSIVSSVNAESSVAELRAQRERVEDLVDDVVQSYHNGFNKAIHNYSRILRLFSESKDQVKKLKASLEDARRRMGAQSRTLQQHWRRGITMGDTVRLLSDINSIVDTPQRLQKLEEAKEYETAVTLLLESCNKLARLEFERVGALRDMKRNMATRRNVLHKMIVQEAEERVFTSVSNLKTGAGGADNDEDEEDADSKALLRNDSLLAMLTSNKLQEIATPRSRDPLSSSAAAGYSLGAKAGGLDWMSMHKGSPELHKPAGSLPLAKLVECLQKLGGVGEAQLTFRRHMPTQVRNVILRALQQSQVDKAAAAAKTHEAAAKAAQVAVERVFEHCLQMMRNLVEVLRLLSTSKPSASGAGLELLLAARGSEDGAAQLPQKQSSQAYVQREADAAWDCVQNECRRLLQELLHAAALQNSNISAAFQSGAGSAWLRGTSENGGSMGNTTAAGTQSFSFDVQVAGMAPQAVLDRMQSMAPMRPTETMAQQALGGGAGGTYLAPALYRPVVQFVDGGRKALEAADAGSDQPGAHLPRDQGSARSLRTFLESFITQEFLPEVYVTFR
ncbi:g6307 [Coccomyxa viridis]|uniref:Exocyst complex component Sec8 n=1 Tax=Coccomyxa viridis TaxID=1274662 RepID=A0ABP1FXK9_9CHLO